MKNVEYERICACTLNRIFGFLPKISYSLINKLGSAEAVFNLDKKSISDLFRQTKYAELINNQELDKSAKELESLENKGCRFLCITEDDYPSLLKECEDPPIGLYYKSAAKPAEIFQNKKFISIVGTRDISPYGKEWCQKLTYELSRTANPPTIVSGLAYGVDGIAHKSAIEYHAPTIGVMATGIDSIYPWRHTSLANTIASTPNSALITDYPPGAIPKAINFLRRNRIIAGLAETTILIESKIKGGGMMTANLAYSYNRDVYALPGRIDDIRSQGCNKLIKNKIAEPIISAEDLLQSLGMTGLFSSENPINYAKRLYSDMENHQIDKIVSIIKIIKSKSGISIDDICLISQFSRPEVMSIVTLLESDGIISTDILQRCSMNEITGN